MPKIARSHEDALKVVCATCLNKAPNIKKVKLISKTIEKKIKEIIPSFSISDNRLPKILCSSCYIKLCSGALEKENVVKYSELNIRLKRSEIKCSCAICEVSRSKGSSPSKLSINKNVVGRPSSAVPRLKNLKICAKCNAEIVRFKRHLCNLSNKVSNTLQLANGCEEQVSSKYLLSITKKNNNNSIVLNKGRGRSLLVNVHDRKRGEHNEERRTLSAEILQKIQLKCNMSMSSLNVLRRELQNVDKNLVDRGKY